MLAYARRNLRLPLTTEDLAAVACLSPRQFARLFRAETGTSPAKAVEAFIRSGASRVPMSRGGANEQFDLIVERARAATGEVQLGKLIYAGLSGDARKLQLTGSACVLESASCGRGAPGFGGTSA